MVSGIVGETESWSIAISSPRNTCQISETQHLDVCSLFRAQGRACFGAIGCHTDRDNPHVRCCLNGTGSRDERVRSGALVAVGMHQPDA